MLKFTLSSRSNRYTHTATSIGPELGIVDGKERWWEAVGEAKKDFESLVPDINQLLEDSFQPVSSST
jgi:hypothetical protein